MTNCEGSSRIPPRDLTPRDDVKKTVSEVLKRVDNFIRKGELDQAEHCVLQARELDPKNIYAYAFQERITVLKDQAHKTIPATAASGLKNVAKDTKRDQIQSNEIPTKQEQPKIQPLQPRADLIPQAQLPINPQKEVEPEPQPKAIQNIEMKSVVVGPHPMSAHVSNVTAPKTGQQIAEAQRKIDDDRNLKIQRMIKIAVDSVRTEIESKQMEIRAKEREEFERREHFRIREAEEAARRGEEQRQIELRKKSEEQLQQKIREALQRKPVVENPVVSLPPNREVSAAQSETESHNSCLPPTECRMSAERQETLERYRLVLSSVWADGAISEEESSTLKQLRESLAISSEEHARIEKEVQRETYIEAFKKAWHSGTITQENASVLAELRQRFQITNEEHLSIESRILWEIQPVKNRPTLLVVDDDERLLKVVSKTLNEAGFITTPVTTSDEAYTYLKDSSPDLILCDVNLETSTMGGFAFYEKVREFERLRDTPFIFLSGLTDEALVRTGKELGVDDYLSKPISEETLVATIRGKLRRYHELKQRLN